MTASRTLLSGTAGRPVSQFAKDPRSKRTVECYVKVARKLQLACKKILYTATSKCNVKDGVRFSAGNLLKEDSKQNHNSCPKHTAPKSRMVLFNRSIDLKWVLDQITFQHMKWFSDHTCGRQERMVLYDGFILLSAVLDQQSDKRREGYQVFALLVSVAEHITTVKRTKTVSWLSDELSTAPHLLMLSSKSWFNLKSTFHALWHQGNLNEAKVFKGG